MARRRRTLRAAIWPDVDAPLPPALRGNALQAAYWTQAQLIPHHIVNGCNLQPGLLGSGTLSGAVPDEAGSLLELTNGGRNEVALPSGESRTFLEDGDTLTLKGCWEQKRAVRIGVGHMYGNGLPAIVAT